MDLIGPLPTGESPTVHRGNGPKFALHIWLIQKLATVTDTVWLGDKTTENIYFNIQLVLLQQLLYDTGAKTFLNLQICQTK